MNKWYSWVLITMLLGVITGIVGDLHLHNTQVATAMCTVGSGLVTFGILLGVLS